MSIRKYVAAFVLVSPFLNGCEPAPSPDTASRYHALGGGWLSNNSSQAFGGLLQTEQIRGIFYSTTPPRGTEPSPTGWWVRAQNSDYYAPIDSITYNGEAVSELHAEQGFFHVTVGGNSLVAQGSFDLRFQVGGSSKTTLRFVSTQGQAAYGRYEAQWSPQGSSAAWSSFCPHAYQTEDGEAINLPEYVIPIDGARWLLNGTRVEDSASIQLACTHDSIGGCVEWGYAPWASQGGTSLRDTHQACTRMKRADFCGTGDPATTTNQSAYMHTQIQVWDALAIHPAGAQTISTMEAFWNKDGATCFNQAQYRSHLPNYIAHMQALVALCPKPACTKSSSGLVASARPCQAVDPTTNTCTQN